MPAPVFILRGAPWRWIGQAKRFPKGYNRAHGLCSWATQAPADGGTIRIAARVVEAERLETEVHEALHACMPDIDEEAIHDTARDVAAVLWALGYRCQ